MKIRKEFTVESAHIVRNCTSHRCSHSIHGHSAKIEVFFESEYLDNAQMVYDFGLMKSTIKEFIDSMDHSYLLCKHDGSQFKRFIKESCDRWIELPCNPTAEMLSVFIMNGINTIMKNTRTQNGECRSLRCTAVRYHETSTGYAECDQSDVDRLRDNIMLSDTAFSEGVIRDWSRDLKDILYNGKTVINPIVNPQIKL